MKPIHRDRHHFGWDNANEPVLRVAAGETVSFEVVDAGGGQLGRSSTVADVAALDFARVNPVTGPVYVDGAEPGDALLVEVLDFQSSGWGWTAIIPGFGLLAEDFPRPFLHITSYGAGGVEFAPGIRLPLRPFPGTIGVAPAEPGLHSVVPPREGGGDMGIRGLTKGAKLWLPVRVPGALFSVGDTHAAQGDGEVCGTAIESPMDVVLTLDLVKDARLKTPRFTTPGPVTRHLDAKGYEVTTGIGPDLMTGAREAVSQMIDLLAGRYGM